MTDRLVALALVSAAALVQVGCASDTHSLGASEDDFATTANGLWALEGEAQEGDLELLQLDRRSFAGVVRETPAPAYAARSAAPTNDDAVADTGRAATGNLARVGRSSSAKVALVANDQRYTVAENGDTLTLTTADGRALTYKRTYRLYCVATDRSIEATALVELGKEPRLVGVNGDGRVFPKAGTYAASIQSDVLMRLHEYVVTATMGSSTITVKLPWEAMNRPEVEGTLAIAGLPTSAPPTPISCERVPTN